MTQMPRNSGFPDDSCGWEEPFFSAKKDHFGAPIAPTKIASDRRSRKGSWRRMGGGEREVQTPLLRIEQPNSF